MSAAADVLSRKSKRHAQVVRSGSRYHWELIAVIGAFVVGCFLVPTLAPVSVSDDAMYARSAEILLRQHQLRTLPLSAVTQVFQTGWGAFFGFLFGHSLGVLRVSTVVMTVIAVIASYGLCRELGVNRSRSALGAAVYLFNPLGYVLAFTFMTDALLTALIVVAVYCYVRGLSRGADVHGWWLAAGSVTSALAFLVRQPGALVPVGVVAYLVTSRRLRVGRAGLRILAQVVVVPVVTVAAYYVWSRLLNGIPSHSAQGYVARQIKSLPGSFRLVRKLVFVEAIYPGFFVLPIALGVLGFGPRLLRATRTAGLVVLGIWAAAVGAGFALYHFGTMPYFPQFFTASGLGPSGDIRGGRPPLLNLGVRLGLTVLTVIAAGVLLLSVWRSLTTRSDAASLTTATATGAATHTRDCGPMVVWVLIFQVFGVFGPSAALRSNFATLSRDRYFLPLLPLVVCLLLWALRGIRIAMPVAWVATVCMTLYAVAGTHDYLGWQRATWKMAREAHQDGVAYTRLDAGFAWDTYHLYEYSLKHGSQLPIPPGFTGPLLLSKHDVEAVWIPVYAPAITRADYVVTSEQLLGYTTIRRLRYASWLRSKPTYVYLVRLHGVSGLP